MLKRIVGLVVAVLFVSNVPAALPQQEQAQPIFTFVSGKYYEPTGLNLLMTGRKMSTRFSSG